ncbi:LAMI_0D10550g1_1 [Lachancea mirantina]|uniref:Sensitive to high expression protein 9, mitochondrial n=1 Tax=Lachancea mirantina TaxID=1230905 RepID=A0A1G4JEL9_9SACH|nr:LAMI_0D10550g1_1 [Lachancea mirantina]
MLLRRWYPTSVSCHLRTATFRYYSVPRTEKEPLTMSNDTGPKNRSSIEVGWSTFKNKISDVNSSARAVSLQIKDQINKAKAAVREADRRFEEQDKIVGNDDQAGYKKDFDTQATIGGLPSERERKRRRWARKLEFYFDSLQETIFTATRALNDVTGYSAIQKLRKSIESMESQLTATKGRVKESKGEYDTAIAARSQSQRELNELLQRKNAWTPQDLEQFTQLYKDDAVNLQRQEDAKQRLAASEQQEDELSNDLYRAILTRYHEEQIWSDKIRRTSSWGTFILMGVNIVLFLVFQLLLEPWKRRRLVGSFEDKVQLALEEYASSQNTKLDAMSSDISTKMASRSVEAPSSAFQKSESELSISASSQQPPTQFSALAMSSPREFFTTLKLNTHALISWVSKFLGKLYQLQRSNSAASITLSKPELVLYSTIVVSISWLLSLGTAST